MSCFALQVLESTTAPLLGEQDSADVVTRRSQFRMKKNRKQNKQDKKAAKEAEKEANKVEKARKKKEKAELKAQQAADKKRIRETEKANKANKKQKTAEAPEEENDSQGKEMSNKGANQEVAISGAEEAWPEEPVVMPKKLFSRMKTWGPKHKLPELKHAKECNKVKKIIRQQQRAHKSHKSDHGDQTAACCQQVSAGSDTKANTKGKTAKGKTKPSAKTASSRKDKQQKAQKALPCPEVVKLVQQVVAECESSNCVHPTWKPKEFDQKMFQLSVYWTRYSVGIKMPKDVVNSEKKRRKNAKPTKSKCKWSQIAYFACKTSCVYTNMVLAYKFVSWLISGKLCSIPLVVAPFPKNTEEIYIYICTYHWIYHGSIWWPLQQPKDVM